MDVGEVEVVAVAETLAEGTTELVALAEAVADGTEIEVVVASHEPSALELYVYSDNNQAFPHITVASPTQGLLHDVSGFGVPPLPTYEFPQ